MKKYAFRNFSIIVLLAVWSFWAGAYFSLGWVRSASDEYIVSFVTGGLAFWAVMIVLGIILYKNQKRNYSHDPAKLPLYVVGFFTLCFTLIALYTFRDVRTQRAQEIYLKKLNASFSDYYLDKSRMLHLDAEDLSWEISTMYDCVEILLDQKEETLHKIVEQNAPAALIQDNQLIKELCKECIELHEEFNHPYPEDIKILFSH